MYFSACDVFGGDCAVGHPARILVFQYHHRSQTGGKEWVLHCSRNPSRQEVRDKPSACIASCCRKSQATKTWEVDCLRAFFSGLTRSRTAMNAIRTRASNAPPAVTKSTKKNAHTISSDTGPVIRESYPQEDEPETICRNSGWAQEASLICCPKTSTPSSGLC